MYSSMDIVQYDSDLSLYHAIADVRGIGWKSIEEPMANLEPTNIPEEVVKLEIMNSVTFLYSLTHYPSVKRRIPP